MIATEMCSACPRYTILLNAPALTQSPGDPYDSYAFAFVSL